MENEHKTRILQITAIFVSFLVLGFIFIKILQFKLPKPSNRAKAKVLSQHLFFITNRLSGVRWMLSTCLSNSLFSDCVFALPQCRSDHIFSSDVSWDVIFLQKPKEMYSFSVYALHSLWPSRLCDAFSKWCGNKFPRHHKVKLNPCWEFFWCLRF